MKFLLLAAANMLFCLADPRYVPNLPHLTPLSFLFCVHQGGLGGRGRELVLVPAGLLRGVPYFRGAEPGPHAEASASVAPRLAHRNNGSFTGTGAFTRGENGGGGGGIDRRFPRGLLLLLERTLDEIFGEFNASTSMFEGVRLPHA